ncbi:MAG TPA: diguanylate cyclase [Dissulfurispiraceae bacterium]|nr:diguanylate cyclase [Dissulfurispiraceae bacterium]
MGPGGLSDENESLRRMLTKMKQAELELRESLERYSALIESTDDSVYLVDAQSRYLFMNKKHLSRMKLHAGEVLGRAYGDFHTHEETAEFVRQVGNVMQSCESIQQEHKSGRDGCYFLRTLSPVMDSSNVIKAVTVISKNITPLKTLEAELYALSLSDELTRLYNRRGFLTLAGQQLKIARRTKEPMLLVFADLNGFKRINDSYGHTTGDTALKEFTAVLKQTFRESDIIARIGGDEFVILIRAFRAGDEKEYLKRLQHNLERFNAKGTRPYTLSISTGVVVCDHATTCSVEKMLIEADRRMYEQKIASQTTERQQD